MMEYLPVAVFVGFSIAFAGVLVALGYFLAPSEPNVEKLSPYESGFEAFEDARMKFDVRFFLIAILFIIFDLELIFLIPWATAMKMIGLPGIMAVVLFLVLLTVGFAYEWKKGALEWD